MQTEVGDQLARMLLAGKVHDGDTVLVDQTGGEHLELGTMPEDPDAGSDTDARSKTSPKTSDGRVMAA